MTSIDLRHTLKQFTVELEASEKRARTLTKEIRKLEDRCEATKEAIVLDENLLSGTWVYENLTGNQISLIADTNDFPKLVKILRIGGRGGRSLQLKVKKQVAYVQMTNGGDLRLSFQTGGFEKIAKNLGDIRVNTDRINDQIKKLSGEVGDLVLIKQFVERCLEKKEAKKR